MTNGMRMVLFRRHRTRADLPERARGRGRDGAVGGVETDLCPCLRPECAWRGWFDRVGVCWARPA